MGRAVWLGATRIGVAVAVLGTGAVVRANVASSPTGADAAAEAGSTTTVAPVSAPDTTVASPIAPDEAGDLAAAPTTVLVAAPVPPSREPTVETAAPSHVRSVNSVWLEGDERELHFRSDAAAPCTAELKVEENSAVIYVYVFEQTSPGEACTPADAGEFTARLDGPLGERVVVDAVSGEQFVVGLGDPAEG